MQPSGEMSGDCLELTQPSVYTECVRVCKCSCVHVCIDEGACSCVLVRIYMRKTEVDLIEPVSSGRPVSPRQHHLFYFPRVGLASMDCHTWICMWFIILELLRKAL